MDPSGTRPPGVKMHAWRDVSVDGLIEIRPWWDVHAAEERGQQIEQQGDEWIIATVDGEAVGWIVLRWGGTLTHPDYPSMEDLYVKESWRGRGVGTSLIGHVEAEARRRGHSRFGLAVNPTLNGRARILYERLGYEHTGGDTYLDGVYDGVEDWVIDLAKDL